MTITAAALVLGLIAPPSLLNSATLGQGKVQIIKGKKGTVKAAGAGSPENTPVQVSPSSTDAAKAQALDQQSKELEARSKELDKREQALSEKESAAAEAEKKKADQQKAQQKHLEKISEQNQQMLQQASDSLAGD